MERDDKSFIDWESVVFGYGYGTGEGPIIKALKDFMDAIPEGERQYDSRILEKKLGATVAWLLINILCKEDLVDYGCSPRGGWLNEKGERLREYLKKKTVDELEELVCNTDDEDYKLYCTKDYCNCGEQQVMEGCKNNIFWNDKI